MALTNGDKMRELVGMGSSNEEIVSWAYANRITVGCLDLCEPFESMADSVSHFIENANYFDSPDEHDAWRRFLKTQYIEEVSE